MKHALYFLVISCLVLISAIPDAEARGRGAARAQMQQGARAQMIQAAIAKHQLQQGGASRSVMIDQRRSRGVKFM